MYKIIFTLRSAVSFIDRPMFDGMLSYCVAKEMFGDLAGKLTLSTEEVSVIHDAIPLKRDKDGWFHASWMLWDEHEAIEFTDSWKKRWDEKHDHVADFGKRKRKVRITAGEFKSYNMPLTLHQIKTVWFMFDTDNPERVRDLVAKYLFGIGKKTSQGWGEIEGFEINEVEAVKWDGLRPLPVHNLSSADIASLNLRFIPYKPPYWLPENFGWCKV